MSRALVAAVFVAALVPSALPAQRVRIAVQAVTATYGETNEVATAEGAGIGASLVVRVGRFGFDASGYTASLDPEDPANSSFDVLQGDIRVGVALHPLVALEVGVGRRTIDPDFAAQDVGLFRVGLRSENRLSRLGSVWVRGAYLISPQFDGGGDAGLALELGLGASFGTANGRFRIRADYEFQRLDRDVNVRSVPIELSLARVGIEVGLF